MRISRSQAQDTEPLRTNSENRVDVVHGLSPDVCELLDLLGNILDLFVGKDQFELLNS